MFWWIILSCPTASENSSSGSKDRAAAAPFQQVSRFMVRDMSLQEVLQGIVALVVEFMQCDSCLIYLVDNDRLVSVHPTIRSLTQSERSA